MEGEYLYIALGGRRISLYYAVWKVNIFTLRCMEGEYLYTVPHEREYLYTALGGRRIPLY